MREHRELDLDGFNDVHIVAWIALVNMASYYDYTVTIPSFMIIQ